MRPVRRMRLRLLCAVVVALYLASPPLATLARGSDGSVPGQSPSGSGNADTPVSTFAINTASAYPIGVTTDASGNVWFAEDNPDSLVEFVTSNSTMKSFAIPTPHHLAWIWFTSLKSDQVGYFDIAGEKAVLARVANITAPVPGSGVSGITVDSAGDVFVAESFQAKIVELDGSTLSVIRTWRLPVGSQPVGLALDPARGRLWFTNHASSFFGYVSLNSSGIKEYPTSLFFEGGDYTVTLPYWVFLSNSGEVWFNEHVGNRISRFDPGNQQLTEFEIPTNSSSPLMLSLDDRRGVVWFTEFSGNALGVLAQNSTLGGSTSVSVVTPAADPTATLEATATPSGPSPVVSITGGSTGTPTPGFVVSTRLGGGSYQVGLTANMAGPGNYTAAVCFRYPGYNQCGYALIVVPQPGTALPLLYSVYAAAGLGVVALTLLLVRGSRRDRVRRRTLPP